MATKTSLLGLTKPAYTDAADIAVLNGNFDLIDKAVGNGARVVNLLDNSWFVNPINQRGQSSYTGTGGKVYMIDRWHTWSPDITVSLGDGYVSITNSSDNEYQQFTQLIASHGLTGKAVTLVIRDADGVYCASGTLMQGTMIAGAGSSSFWMSVQLMDDGNAAVAIYPRAGQTARIKWAALYEGAYTADTLPAYVYKGYAAELAECQRYFQKGGQVVTVGTQYGTATKGIIRLRFCGMRSMPNITITGISSQGWGNIALEHLSKEWTSQVGTDCFQNYMIEGDSSFVGQTIGVEYEASADL